MTLNRRHEARRFSGITLLTTLGKQTMIIIIALLLLAILYAIAPGFVIALFKLAIGLALLGAVGYGLLLIGLLTFT